LKDALAYDDDDDHVYQKESNIHHGIIVSNDQADETNVSDAQKALNLKDPYHLIILL